ncbi:hypothetical protein BJV82DRAFT_600813 [Fennellomyces sp. T-0311]|nr:hypothetical protein BJV82DRAFT_600813 [Fennellomyces sp. T-0311]
MSLYNQTMANFAIPPSNGTTLIQSLARSIRSTGAIFSMSNPTTSQKAKKKAKNTLVDQACFTMEGVAAEVAEDKRHRTTDGEPESGVEETMSLKKLSDYAKESDLGLSGLDIVAITDPEVADVYRNNLSDIDYNAIFGVDVPRWTSEKYCQKLMDALSADDLDSRDLCVIIRMPVIPSQDYYPIKHYDLRIVDSIASRWVDLMNLPSNHIAVKCGERKSAIGGAISVLNALFLHNNDQVKLDWIEVEVDGTKRHKFDGVLNDVENSKATIMLIEFAGGFGHRDVKKLRTDTHKVYRNALRLIDASKSKPNVFVVLTWDRQIFFETVTLVKSNTFVRSRQATLTVPHSPRGVKKVMEAMPQVFTWRNTVLESLDDLPSLDHANIETPMTPSTP